MKTVKKHIAVFVMLCFALVLAVPTQTQADSKVKISKSKMSIVVGQQKTLKVKNTTKKVTWSSSKKSVAKVNSKGVVTAKKEGTATITAKVGKKKYTCKVTVKEKPSLVQSETICIGKKIQLRVEGTAKKVRWSSSNKKVVKVDKKGNIRGLKKGSAIISAKVGDKILKCKVKVKDAILYKIDRTVNVTDSEFVIVTHLSDTISCKVSDPEVADVTAIGTEQADEGPGYETNIVIYAKKNGTSYVTVSNDCNDKKMKFKIVVKKTVPSTAEEKLRSYVIERGDFDAEGNKVITRVTGQEKTKVIYNYWEKDLEYEYEETNEKAHVKWTLLVVEPSAANVVMWITPEGEKESKYVTADVDLTKYNGETLVYEDAWYGTAVSEEFQEIASEVTGRAYQHMDELLKPVGVTLQEVFKSE